MGNTENSHLRKKGQLPNYTLFITKREIHLQTVGFFSFFEAAHAVHMHSILTLSLRINEGRLPVVCTQNNKKLSDRS